MTIFISSDLHINHAKIREYCPLRKERWGDDLEAMNCGIIEEWNSKMLSSEDKIYILGDFFMGPKDKFEGFTKRLNFFENCALIAGNHDSSKARELFNEVYEELYIKLNGKTYWMHHFPLGEVDYNDRGYVRPEATQQFTSALNGHVHDKWVSNGKSLNVGLDAHDLKILTLEEVETLCELHLRIE